MDTSRILAGLRDERDRINKAISALESLDLAAGAVPRHGRAAAAGKSAATPPRRRRMSAAARKHISEMMKRRWAERKKKSKPA